jgi:hypothetical protein
MKQPTTWAALAVATVTLSGCYTVLQGPRLASSLDEGAGYHVIENGSPTEPQIGRLQDDRYDDDPWANTRGYGSGYPVMGYGSGYGFGSPFAYGPGLGAAYPYSGYSSYYGPYGYGYDPYYTGRGSYGSGSYVPPGYQLVTSRELANLRAEITELRNTGSDIPPSVDRQEALRRKQRDADRAWTQRTVPVTRKSTSGYRTPRVTSTSSTSRSSSGTKASSSTSSTKPASSSSSKSSGGDAAKRRKTRR